MAGRELPPPPSRVQEFEITWRNWLYLLFKKIVKRTYTIELAAYNSVSPVSAPMTDNVIGNAPVVLADDTNNESRYLSFNVPLDWVVGSDFTIKIRFANTTTQTGVKTVITLINYVSNPLETVISGVGTVLTDTISLETGVVANTLHVSGDMVIPATAIAAGDTIFLRLQRDAVNDTCVADIAYQSIIIEYTGFLNHE